jgi:hypothetical protein
MADRDWKQDLLDALDSVRDRIRRAIEAVDAALSPEPELIPVPIPARRPQRDGRDR